MGEYHQMDRRRMTKIWTWLTGMYPENTYIFYFVFLKDTDRECFAVTGGLEVSFVWVCGVDQTHVGQMQNFTAISFSWDTGLARLQCGTWDRKSVRINSRAFVSEQNHDGFVWGHPTSSRNRGVPVTYRKTSWMSFSKWTDWKADAEEQDWRFMFHSAQVVGLGQRGDWSWVFEAVTCHWRKFGELL